MIVIRFRSKEDHKDIVAKVKKMRKFATELEECLEDGYEEDMEYRGGSYRKEMMEDEPEYRGGRYGYRGGR